MLVWVSCIISVFHNVTVTGVPDTIWASSCKISWFNIGNRWHIEWWDIKVAFKAHHQNAYWRNNLHRRLHDGVDPKSCFLHTVWHCKLQMIVTQGSLVCGWSCGWCQVTGLRCWGNQRDFLQFGCQRYWPPCRKLVFAWVCMLKFFLFLIASVAFGFGPWLVW